MTKAELLIVLAMTLGAVGITKGLTQTTEPAMATDKPPKKDRQKTKTLSSTLVADKVVIGGTELALHELRHGPVAHYYCDPPKRSMDTGPAVQRFALQLGALVHTNHSMGLLLPGAIAGVAVERLETTKANAAAGGSVLLSAAVAVAATALLVLVAAAALLVLMLLLALQALLLLQLLPAAFSYTVNPAAAFVTLCMPTGISQATKGNHHHVGPPLVTTALSHIRRPQICETAYRTTWN